MKSEDPSKHRCLCGQSAAEWDPTTHTFRCAGCAKFENSYYSTKHEHIFSGVRTYIEPYKVHLTI